MKEMLGARGVLVQAFVDHGKLIADWLLLDLELSCTRVGK